MPALTLALLGPPQVIRADGGAVTFRSRKHLALLAYLAVEQRHSHSRDTLPGLLWSEAPEDAARSNLRVALADLRRLLGEGDSPFLLASRHSVQFSPASSHTLDVEGFSTLLAECAAHAHDAPASCDSCIARLVRAVELYRGDFLAGFALPNNTTFEEWALVLREHLHQQALDALDTLAGACLNARATPRRCAGTPAASLCWSPGASRPTASSCAAWRSPATAVRRWRSTRSAGACCWPSSVSIPTRPPPRSPSRSAQARVLR